MRQSDDGKTINVHRLRCLVAGQLLPLDTLSLGAYVGHGRTGVVFRLGHGLVAKVVDISPSAALSTHPDRHERHAGGSTALAIRHEAQLLANQLAPLQGDVVPRFHGLWSVGDPATVGLLILITSYAGAPLGGDLDAAEHAPRLHAHAAAVRSAYDKLHAVGVEHVDVAPRHILEQDGVVTLVDFEAAIAPDSLSSSEAALRRERRVVEDMLRCAASSSGGQMA